jgi:poly(A) polymerase
MPSPVIRPRAEHNISRKNIDPEALKVLYRLRGAGYMAYLVGGGVRDLLLDRAPKDFDIGTDAHPHDIKKIFRNARLIGRRFRLAHIVFGTKIIEVSTFRKKSEYAGEDPADLLVRRDNTFGTPEEDALRRDFTVNGLFYDIATFSLIDYVGGLDDLEARLIRAIGDPRIRFREDPIRMLRAIKFAARLGMEIEPAARAALIEERWEIPKAAPPRIVEEIMRTLRGGSARKSYQLMRELGVLEVILPRFEQFLASTEENVFLERMRFWEALEALDEARAGGRDLAPAVLVGCLVLPLLRAQAEARGLDLEHAATVEELLEPIATEMHLPRRETERLRLMVLLQARLARGTEGRGARSLPGRPAFREALDLFEIFASASGDGMELVSAWRTAADGTAPAKEPARPRRKRRRRRREPGEEVARPAPAPKVE